MTATLQEDATTQQSGEPTTQRRRFGRGANSRSWRPDLGTTAGLGLSAPFIVMALLLILAPFVQLVQESLANGGLGNYTEWFAAGSNLRALRVTFGVSGVVTVVAVGGGALLAWSLRTTASPVVRAVVLAAVLIPFWMGTVMKLYAWTVLLQRNGVVNDFLVSTGLVDQPLDLLYNQLAVTLGMTHQMLPYAVLPLYVAFLSIDVDLIKAAEGLGASRLRAIWSVAVPLAAPGILATVVLVFVLCIGFFLTPVVLGGFTAPFSSSLIAQNIFVFYDVVGAAVTAICLLAAAALIVAVGVKIVGADRLRKALG